MAKVQQKTLHSHEAKKNCRLKFISDGGGTTVELKPNPGGDHLGGKKRQRGRE